MSQISKIDDLIVIVRCDDCLSGTEWRDCDKHTESECYKIECLNCGWAERDCDTTEHGEIIQ